MERILIATDGSAAASEAIQFGVELAADEGATVTFVHVVPEHDVLPTGAYTYGAAVPHEPTERDYVSLRTGAAVAAEHGVEATTKLLKGHPTDEIVAYADSSGADLIVVGSRGHGALTRTLLGSVSHGVLTETRKPVLVVRGTALVEAEAAAEPVAAG